MKVPLLKTNGTKSGQIELPLVFSTEFRKDLIHKSFINLQSHRFQPQGRHPTAGMDVVARSNDLQAEVRQELQKCVEVEEDVKVKLEV